MTGSHRPEDNSSCRTGGHIRRAHPVLHGREPEHKAVCELVRRATKGRSGALLIEGEPGMGKSMLLAEAAKTARKEHVLVAAAHGDEVNSSAALGTLLDLQRELPIPAAGDGTGDNLAVSSERLAGAWRKRLDKHAGGSPVLLSLDDLQWADHASLHALGVLLTQLASYPVVWLLARNIPDASSDGDQLFELLESRGAGRLTLGPLGTDAVYGLITDAIGAVPDGHLLTMANGATGNPFLLGELIGGLVEEDAITIRDGRAVLHSRHMPKRVQAAVRRMLRGLTPRTRHLLETTAVLGPSFRVTDAAVMLGTPAAALLPYVEEAIACHLLVPGQDSLAFRHGLVWRAVVEGMPRPVSQALHRQFGEILLARGGSAASAAAHLLSGTEAGDVTALAELDRAAAEVLPTRPGVAADLATHVLELTQSSDPKKLPRTIAAASALTAAGQPGRAAQLARPALAVPMPAAASAGLRCAMSSALLLCGEPAGALKVATEVLAERETPEKSRADARTVQLQALAGLRDYRRAGELAAAIVAAPGEQQCELVSTALVVLAGILWDTGRLRESMAVSADAVRVATGQPADAWRIHPHLFLAARLVDLRRFDEAHAVLRSASAHFDAFEPIQWSATAPTLDARMALASGRLDEAAGHAKAALRLAGNGVREGSTARAVLATVALRRGDLKTAREHLDGNPAHGGGPPRPRGATWDSIVAAQVREAFDGPRAALETFAQAYDEVGRSKFPLLCDPVCAPWLVRTALAAGDRKRAEAVGTAASQMTCGNPEFAVIRISAAHTCGLLERDRDRLETAAVQHPDRWARASAAEDLAVTELDAGHRRAAVGRLDQALEDYQATGAARDTARIRRRLRRLGIRRGHWAAADRPVSGWDSLTATERAVCDLISQGLTNQQAADLKFISVHTIAFHLRQVFRKLGISSRVELTRMAVEQAQAAADSGPERATVTHAAAGRY
jgi:DNA-binding CsgD family transcriptional regulator/tetratricopeptide (TPR) repeat protein